MSAVRWVVHRSTDGQCRSGHRINRAEQRGRAIKLVFSLEQQYGAYWGIGRRGWHHGTVQDERRGWRRGIADEGAAHTELQDLPSVRGFGGVPLGNGFFAPLLVIFTVCPGAWEKSTITSNRSAGPRMSSRTTTGAMLPGR